MAFLQSCSYVPRSVECSMMRLAQEPWQAFVTIASARLSCGKKKRWALHRGPIRTPFLSLPLDFFHLRKDRRIPEVRVGGTVLLGGGVGEMAPIAAGEACGVCPDRLGPRAPAGASPSPGVVRGEAVASLAALDARDGRREAGVNAIVPCRLGKGGTVSCEWRAGKVVIDACPPACDEGVLVALPVDRGGRTIGRCLDRGAVTRLGGER